MTLEQLVERLLDLTQVAERLNVSERMVRRLLDEGKLPKVKVGRHVRVPESAIGRYIEANTKRAAPWAR